VDDAGRASEERPRSSNWAQSLASGSARLFGAQLVANAGFFFAVLILARALSLSERGTVAFLVVAALIVGHIAGLGLGDATVVLAATFPASRSRILTNLLVVSVVASTTAGVGVSLALGNVDQLRPPGVGTAELFLLGIAIVVVALAEAGRLYLLGCSLFRAQAIIQAAWPWLYVSLLLIIATTKGLGVEAAIASWISCFGAAALALVTVSIRHEGVGKVDGRLLFSAVRFGVRALGYSAARVVNFRADQILMAFLATEATLGIYAVAVNASEMLLYLPSAIGAAIVPAIGSTEESRRAERTLETFRALLLITIGGVALAGAFGPILVPIAFGNVYENSVVPFLFLLPGAIGFAAVSVFSGALVAAGRPGRASIGSVVAVLIGLGLDFILIPEFEATGAAAAASLAFLAGGGGSILFFRGAFPFPWKAILPRGRDLRAVLHLTGVGIRTVVRRRSDT